MPLSFSNVSTISLLWVSTLSAMPHSELIRGGMVTTCTCMLCSLHRESALIATLEPVNVNKYSISLHISFLMSHKGNLNLR